MTRPAGQGFLPAAETILKRAGRPLTCREIVERATEAGILDSRGKTPWNTLSALLNRHIEAEGDQCRFQKVGPGKFELKR